MSTGIYTGVGEIKRVKEIRIGAGGVVKNPKGIYIGCPAVKKVWPMSGKDLFDVGKYYGTTGSNMHTMRWRNSSSSGSGSDYWRISNDGNRKYVNDNTMQLDFGYNQGTSPKYSGDGMESVYAIYISWCWSESSSISVPSWVIDGLNQYHYTISCKTTMASTGVQSVTLYNSTLKKYVACVRINFNDRCNHNSAQWNTPTLQWTL